MEEVKREVELDCDIDRAWQALTDEAELEQWLGGEVSADLRPGGEITVRESDGTLREGFIEQVDPGREIVFWWSAAEEESSRVELQLEPLTEGEGCVVRVTESRPLIGLESELARMTASAGFALV